MNVVIAVDGHYYRTKDNKVYSGGVYGYSFFKRYLQVFENVYVLARVKDVEELPRKCKEATGDHVQFVAIPLVDKPTDLIGYRGKLYKIISQNKAFFDCAVVRTPSATANDVYHVLKKIGVPIALEVVVDPWEYFAPNTIKRMYRPFMRVLFTRQLRKMCSEAPGVAYVTERYLQGKYPCQALSNRDGYFTASYSSVEIADASLALPRKYEVKQERFHFVHAAATFSSEGKGQPVVMRALKKVIDAGYDADVTFIGDGPLRSHFEEIARELDISDRVIFTGQLPGSEAVRNELRKADVFVFPTRAEGLPRVLLEAMSDGLPCISSNVCGIPEILEKEWMITYDDADALANLMKMCIEQPETLTRQSERNIKVAANFVDSILCVKRNDFYSKLMSLAKDERRTYGKGK